VITAQTVRKNGSYGVRRLLALGLAGGLFPWYVIGVPAFPGAEGFGANASGGRGGKVVIVSNLNDSGAGSFREACEKTPGPRIVVFAVSGLIDLQTPIQVREPNLTIAAQTAPGEGICLRKCGLLVRTSNVIVRFLRSRPGPLYGTEMDAISIGGDSAGPEYHDAIFDHCSANWSVDECLSPSGPIYNITVQWCLIGEPLNKSVHPKGPHAYGSLVHGIGGLTLHHNLWIDCDERSPRLGDNFFKPPWPTFDIRNNVMYNWGKMCSGLTGDELSTNYVGNYLRPGPSSSDRPPIILTRTARVKYFVQGNVYEGRPNYATDPAAMFAVTKSQGGVNKKAKAEDLRKPFTLVDQPFTVPVVATTTAEEAYRAVLAQVGAIAPVRDAVDQRLVNQVITRTGRIIDSPDEVGGWPKYRSADAPTDSDRDGMPDAWELARGLNPNNPADAARDSGDGYTNIEKYINGLADEAIAKSRGFWNKAKE
jgi:hypothetical protein